MKVVSWNVNGLRASLKNSGTNLKGFLDRLEADIICLQETKAQRDQLDSSMYLADGYSAYFSFCRTKAGYSGVVTFCRDSATPVAAEEGITGALSNERADAVKCYGNRDSLSQEELSSLDLEGRAVLTEHNVQVSEGEEGGEGGRSRSYHQLVVINVYCPMVDVDRGIDVDRLDYKLKFYAAVQERCTALEKAGKIVIATGDFNCSREPIDSAKILDDPDRLNRKSPSRDWMQQFVVVDPSSNADGDDGAQLVDSFRYLHPMQEKAYTCWSTLMDSRKINYGTRIDYILVSKSMATRLRQAEVWQHVEGSDHCPVFAELAVDLFPAQTEPSLCSCNFSAGKQRKLSDFLLQRPRSDSSGSGLAVADKTKKTGKRSGSVVVVSPPPTKARRLESDKKTTSVDSKRSLISFVKLAEKQPSQSDQPSSVSHSLVTNDDEDSVGSSSGAMMSSSQESSSSSRETSQSDSSTNESGKKLSQEWLGVFGGAPKPPLCKGHSEPCVLRTVKKQGPNKNKQFWVCARPGGGKGDPEARCDFFQWRSQKKK